LKRQPRSGRSRPRRSGPFGARRLLRIAIIAFFSIASFFIIVPADPETRLARCLGWLIRGDRYWPSCGARVRKRHGLPLAAEAVAKAVRAAAPNDQAGDKLGQLGPVSVGGSSWPGRSASAISTALRVNASDSPSAAAAGVALLRESLRRPPELPGRPLFERPPPHPSRQLRRNVIGHRCLLLFNRRRTSRRRDRQNME
jgi:hypothetical protein